LAKRRRITTNEEGALVSQPEEERGQNTGKPLKKTIQNTSKNLHKNSLYVKKDVLKWRYLSLPIT